MPSPLTPCNRVLGRSLRAGVLNGSHELIGLGGAEKNTPALAEVDEDSVEARYVVQRPARRPMDAPTLDRMRLSSLHLLDGAGGNGFAQ